MSETPLLSSGDLVRILEASGFRPVLQTGTHTHLWNPENRRLITVPSHTVVALGVVLAIVRKSDIETKVFLKLAAAT